MLPTTVWYPETTHLVGRCPLVVFAHGLDARPSMYAALLRHVAAAGYVVAAPLFPISGSGLPGPPREDDMANQALDLRAVISGMTAAARPGHWLARTLDAREVAVAGHSDGAETAAASVLVSQDQDPRISAVVLLAGQIPTWGEMRPLSIPTLVVQGGADTINPPQLSRDLYERLRAPKAYLAIAGADHMQLVAAVGAGGRGVQKAFVDFLDAELRHDAAARAALRREVSIATQL
ncbi:MAG TPA: alpha/beta hydrolase [Mycobacteriales bacterium]|nr:alpha/beta hydrolase [Mycobacteriales bacterium]